MGLISNIITNAVNKNIADQNLGFQKETFEYNKALQQQQWEREDTSYQRTAQDMLAAGLNPLSMQGTNGAGEVVSQTAPQNNFQMQQTQGNLIDSIASVASGINQWKTGELQRDQLQLQNDRQRLENELFKKQHGLNEESGEFENPFGLTPQQEAELNDFMREYNHRESTGQYTSDNQYEQIITLMNDMLFGERGKEFWDKAKQKYPVLQSLEDFVTGKTNPAEEIKKTYTREYLDKHPISKRAYKKSNPDEYYKIYPEEKPKPKGTTTNSSNSSHKSGKF